MKAQLTHILDQSVCLTRRQMKDYLTEVMQPIESHAVEVHLNACPLCRMAVEGFEENIGEATAALESLNSNFLKEHFETIAPQIHLNSMAPAASFAGSGGKKTWSIQFWRNTAIAASVLLAVGFVWYFESGEKNGQKSVQLALNAPEKTGSTEGKPFVEASADGRKKQINNSPALADEYTENDVSASEIPEAEKSAPAPLYTSSGEMVASSANPPKPFAGRASEKDVSSKVDEVARRSNGGNPIAAADKSNAISDAKTEALQSKRKSETAAAIVAKATSNKAAKSSEMADPAKSLLETGDELLEAGKYERALAQYNRQMQTGSHHDRGAATIKAAHCYAFLGNKIRASELLEYIIETGDGPNRRAARRALRSLNRE